MYHCSQFLHEQSPFTNYQVNMFSCVGLVTSQCTDLSEAHAELHLSVVRCMTRCEPTTMYDTFSTIVGIKHVRDSS